MHRFTTAVAVYILACLIAVGVIVIRGDGPHPRIVGMYPANGDRYFPGGAAEITFSQTMDQASVERALTVAPGAQGQGAWYGNTLNLQPTGDWKQNVTYHLQLTGTVTDELGRPLHTPVTLWFRVHRISRLVGCLDRGIRAVCEPEGSGTRPVFFSPEPVYDFALSPDSSFIAYTRKDRSGLAHLFLMSADGTQRLQLTGGRDYADSKPFWTRGDMSAVAYYRRRVFRQGGVVRYGPPRLWSVGLDGSNNSPL